MITLELPLPPTINHYYKNNGKGGRVLSDETKGFRHDVFYLYRSNRNRASYTNERLQVNIKFIFHTNHVNDIDNRIKPLLDALKHAGCYSDDNSIFRMVVDKEIDKTLKQGKCLVEILKLA